MPSLTRHYKTTWHYIDDINIILLIITLVDIFPSSHNNQTYISQFPPPPPSPPPEKKKTAHLQNTSLIRPTMTNSETALKTKHGSPALPLSRK